MKTSFPRCFLNLWCYFVLLRSMSIGFEINCALTVGVSEYLLLIFVIFQF